LAVTAPRDGAGLEAPLGVAARLQRSLGMRRELLMTGIVTPRGYLISLGVGPSWPAVVPAQDRGSSRPARPRAATSRRPSMRS
jgi:hypothetical protein